jgi:hypothetical protein
VVVVVQGVRVEVLEEFCVDDIERHGQARGLVGQRGVGDQYSDLAEVSNIVIWATYNCPCEARSR